MKIRKVFENKYQYPPDKMIREITYSIKKIWNDIISEGPYHLSSHFEPYRENHINFQVKMDNKNYQIWKSLLDFLQENDIKWKIRQFSGMAALTIFIPESDSEMENLYDTLKIRLDAKDYNL